MAKGRPKGSPNTSSQVHVLPSRCETCGSTKRGPYNGHKVISEYAGNHEGQEYTHIIRRRCQCLDCGQWRIDLSFENHPDGGSPDPDDEEPAGGGPAE